MIKLQRGCWHCEDAAHGALNYDHWVLSHDADGGVHRIDLALAKLTVDGNNFRLKSHQHITEAAR